MMKRFLAVALACVFIAVTPVNVLAATSSAAAQNSGSTSPTAEKIKELEERIKELEKKNKKLQNALTASQKKANSQPQGNGSPAASIDQRTIQLAKNNAVDWGGTIVSQGGHVEINGGRSNVTFMVGVPDSKTLSSANSLAGSVGGSILGCVSVSTSASFRTAKVNFYVSGVTNNDNIAVYQLQSGKWVQLPTAEVRQDHVVVNMTRTGTIAFIRVPVLAAVTY